MFNPHGFSCTFLTEVGLGYDDLWGVCFVPSQTLGMDRYRESYTNSPVLDQIVGLYHFYQIHQIFCALFALVRCSFNVLMLDILFDLPRESPGIPWGSRDAMFIFKTPIVVILGGSSHESYLG